LQFPVYLLKFGFNYQFDESFDPLYEEDRCIYPSGMSQEEIDKMDVKELKKKYSLIANAQMCSKFLAQ
jgi:hypothetical protein